MPAAIWHCSDNLEPGLLCSCLANTAGQAGDLTSLPGSVLSSIRRVSHRCSSLNSLKALGRSTETPEPGLLRSCLAHATSLWLPRLAVQEYSAEVHFRLKQGAADSCSRVRGALLHALTAALSPA